MTYAYMFSSETTRGIRSKNTETEVMEDGIVTIT